MNSRFRFSSVELIFHLASEPNDLVGKSHFECYHFTHRLWSTSSLDRLTDHIYFSSVSTLQGLCLWESVSQGLGIWGLWEAESSVEQSGKVSVRVCWYGDVDDEDALVSDASLWWNCGGLHLEPHKSWSVQRPECVNNPSACLILDAKQSAQKSCLWFLLQYGEGCVLLEDAWLWESWEPYHVVIRGDTWGECEQLVLQQQRRASCTV